MTLTIDICPVCRTPAHASETNDLGQHSDCATHASGYHDCPCRDCFEVAIGADSDGAPSLCHDCESAGCDRDGESDCSADSDTISESE